MNLDINLLSAPIVWHIGFWEARRSGPESWSMFGCMRFPKLQSSSFLLFHSAFPNFFSSFGEVVVERLRPDRPSAKHDENLERNTNRRRIGHQERRGQAAQASHESGKQLDRD